MYAFYVKQSSFLTVFFAKAVEVYSVKTREKLCFLYCQCHYLIKWIPRCYKFVNNSECMELIYLCFGDNDSRIENDRKPPSCMLI